MLVWRAGELLAVELCAQAGVATEAGGTGVAAAAETQRRVGVVVGGRATEAVGDVRVLRTAGTVGGGIPTLAAKTETGAALATLSTLSSGGDSGDGGAGCVRPEEDGTGDDAGGLHGCLGDVLQRAVTGCRPMCEDVPAGRVEDSHGGDACATGFVDAGLGKLDDVPGQFAAHLLDGSRSAGGEDGETETEGGGGDELADTVGLEHERNSR